MDNFTELTKATLTVPSKSLLHNFKLVDQPAGNCQIFPLSRPSLWPHLDELIFLNDGFVG